MKPTAFDELYIRRPHICFVLILLAYFVVETLFVVLTPPWQAPDEPAHYQYVAHIAREHELPVLQAEDYNQEYLSLLLSGRFTPKLSVASLRYESYQPPLYYLSAVPFFWLGNGHLWVMRFYNVLLGAITLYLLYRCLQLVFPDNPLTSLSAVAFSALLPMHVAMNAAVNNDGLAALLFIASTWTLLSWMKRQLSTINYQLSTINYQLSTINYQLTLLGILLGLGLLTKIYAYSMVPISALTIVGVIWWQHRSWRGLWAGTFQALWAVIPALLIGIPLWIRNVQLYGRWDFLGLRWHDQVVVGQAGTVEWISRFGWVNYFERAFTFTFKSFWGVFGWLSVFMDERIYTACLIFTGVLFLGCLWATIRMISGKPDIQVNTFQIAALLLFGLILLAVTASYVWYNTKFVQHQGRYFFWGMIAISTVVAIGWREQLYPNQGMVSGVLALVLAFSLGVTGYLNGTLDKWAILFIVIIGIQLFFQPLLLSGNQWHRVEQLPMWQQRLLQHRLLQGRLVRNTFAGLRTIIWAMPFTLLFLLDLLIPFLYILPQLQP